MLGGSYRALKRNRVCVKKRYKIFLKPTTGLIHFGHQPTKLKFRFLVEGVFPVNCVETLPLLQLSNRLVAQQSLYSCIHQTGSIRNFLDAKTERVDWIMEWFSFYSCTKINVFHGYWVSILNSFFYKLQKTPKSYKSCHNGTNGPE